MRHALLRSICLAVPVVLAACGPTASGPVASAELSALLDGTAYPGGKFVRQDISGGPIIGPFSLPSNYGTRVYTVTDSPRKVQAYYIALAKRKGWTFEGPGGYSSEELGSLTTSRYLVRLLTEDRVLAQGELAVGPSPDPFQSETPSPEPTPPTGPWRLRIDADINT